ncbi:MAG: hypothetical protein NC181_05305 [Clostridium sp.]|nr:hypothetical protein [Clostridium sp.]MCM1444730.1 hypothetical protein [Candidatus Amulumruptor caecigallinarius]
MVAIIILCIILVIVFFVKRTFSGFIYSVGMVDILLRILAYLNQELFSGEVHQFLTNLPTSFPNMISSFTNGALETVLIWVYVVIMMIFEFYIIRTFFYKK